MLDYKSIAWGLSSAEQSYIVLSSALFCVIFIPVSGLNGGWKGAIGFWVSQFVEELFVESHSHIV